MAHESHVLVGRIGKPPELRFTEQGKPVLSFSMAVSHGKKNSDGEWEETPTWYKVTVWGDLGDRLSDKLDKGDKVTVFANRLETRRWKNDDGEYQFSLELNATDIDYPSKPKSDDDEADEKPAKSEKPKGKKQNQKKSDEDNDEEIPF